MERDNKVLLKINNKIKNNINNEEITMDTISFHIDIENINILKDNTNFKKLENTGSAYEIIYKDYT